MVHFADPNIQPQRRTPEFITHTPLPKKTQHLHVLYTQLWVGQYQYALLLSLGTRCVTDIFHSVSMNSEHTGYFSTQLPPHKMTSVCWQSQWEKSNINCVNSTGWLTKAMVVPLCWVQITGNSQAYRRTPLMSHSCHTHPLASSSFSEIHTAVVS